MATLAIAVAPEPAIWQRGVVAALHSDLIVVSKPTLLELRSLSAHALQLSAIVRGKLATLEAAFDFAREIGGVLGRRMADGTHRWTVVITDDSGDRVAVVPVRV
jgi:hypothetical protein